MAQLTIYVDRALAEQVRRLDINVSRACQASLRRQVRLAERRAAVHGTAAMIDARGVSGTSSSSQSPS